MMRETDNSKIVCVIRSLILGTVSFLVSGVAACVLILRFENYIFGTVVAGGAGGLLLGLFHWRRRKIGRMAIAGLIALTIGILGGFILLEALAGGFGLLFPSAAAKLENTGVADILAVVLMGIVIGIIFGAIVYGRKSICLFSVTCGAVSIPFGFLVGAMNSGHKIKALLENILRVFGKIDLNFLATIVGFGIGLGLSIGLYTASKQKSIERD
jgi:uncharacterized membrane protein